MKERARFCQQQIALAQSRMEEQANKSRKPAPNYQPKDMVWLNLKNITTQRPSKKLDDKWARCEVIRRIGNNAYELQLPKGMERLHNVFHTSLLRLDPNDPLPRQQNSEQPPVIMSDESSGEAYEEWEVEEILDSKMMAYGRLVYRVKWLNRQPDRVWYNATGFKNAPEAVEAFHHKYPEKPHSLRIKQATLDQRRENREKAQHDATVKRRGRPRKIAKDNGLK